jgi:type II secretory pathway pseudopilin PulG
LARSSAGETLMEVLLAIVLMGIGFAAVLGGMFTSARIAQVNQRNTQAAQALQGLAEAILQPATPGRPSTYIPCASADGDPISGDQYKGAMDNKPTNLGIDSTWQWRVVSVDHTAGPAPIDPSEPHIWEYKFFGDNTSGSTAKGRSLNSCRTTMANPADPLYGKDVGVQRITIEVTNSNAPAAEQIKRQLTFIKRDHSCPPLAGYANPDLGPC